MGPLDITPGSDFFTFRDAAADTTVLNSLAIK
jgi:hypothetical protein